MIHRETDPMGLPGTALYLDGPADLADLDAPSRAKVPEVVERIFRGFPDTLDALADRAPLPSLVAWLRALRESRCRLEIYSSEYAMLGAAVRLRFHFDEEWSPSFSAVAGELPPDIHPVLAAVHRTIGDVDTQFNVSGTLVPASSMVTLRELVDQRLLMFADEVSERLKESPEYASFRVVFECDGDYLCAAPDGRTIWAGGEWTGAPTTGDAALPTVLTRLFDALTQKKPFRPR